MFLVGLPENYSRYFTFVQLSHPVETILTFGSAPIRSWLFITLSGVACPSRRCQSEAEYFWHAFFFFLSDAVFSSTSSLYCSSSDDLHVVLLIDPLLDDPKCSDSVSDEIQLLEKVVALLVEPSSSSSSSYDSFSVSVHSPLSSELSEFFESVFDVADKAKWLHKLSIIGFSIFSARADQFTGMESWL